MKVGIAGAGAWGTALAVHLVARAAVTPRVALWARDGGRAAEIDVARENARYLPGIALPAALEVTADMSPLVAADLVIVATPMAALVATVQRLASAGVRTPLVWLSKGFVADEDGVALAHQRIAPRWSEAVGVVSGPSFAEEVARGLPTALTVAATAPALAADVAALLRGDTLRAYESDDIAGVETGGAVKNVLAIAAGASDALGFGHNARAALITRGLAETGRLAAALGGRRETLMGLAGLGDLVLTCTGDLSRNRRVGMALAKGEALPQILADLGHVAEGVGAARAVRRLAEQHGVDMPICEAVDRALHEGLPVRDAVAELLRREPRPEVH
ncbi:MAG: NAD(P)-dependent glycerol-3-phosphate dehydrogenase [Betaproteobacteria bacterium]|nr:NAD(P)-dependent glycerol-3-phosphate dehydrogenase [Betaproteobacteria bacterium]